MGAYLRGNAITLVQRFYLVDPLTGVATLEDPTTVTFNVQNPDGVATGYVYGVDVIVTRSAQGIYLCALDPPLPSGDYIWDCVGTGAVEARDEGSFTILPSGLLADLAPATIAEWGPCSPWINSSDVLAALNVDGESLTDADAYKLETAAAIGGSTMWDLSGRQFDGICERTVRPCRDGCSCFGSGILGLGPWSWGWGYGAAFGYGFMNGWVNECGDRCGCGSESYITLAGEPVREILEVKIDGDVKDLSDFRLDDRRHLIYLADPGPPVVNRRWPSCQNLALADDQPGTFSIRYTHGAQPPPLGKQAAAQLAGEVYKSLQNQQCRLPTRATRVIRQGVTVDRIASFAQQWRAGASGLELVDLFIGAVNPTGMTRRPLVVQLDRRGPARQVGQ